MIMMTPELKVALEVVFQEHKTINHSVTWNRDLFRGRLSTGLTEMAKDTLLRKKIILYPNPGKKILTVLNPLAFGATSFEEAEKMVHSSVSVLYPAKVAINEPARVAAVADNVSTFVSKPLIAQRVITMAEPAETVAEIKWYLKPTFMYIIWPLCGAITAVIIAHFISTLYTDIFFDLKK
jgi:hypothetical protein